jgi:peptidoglycan/xylan/chitin deacetylase (PgdA/CDA1 family)
MSHREFGHRVGVFRLLQALERIDVRPAVVIDVLTAERYPRLVDHLVAADPELVAGGLSASRPITGAMSEAEERDYIDETMSRLAAACGVRPRGWLGPEHSESARTPRLLAEAGLGYVADWGNDERPYPMTGEAEGLWAYPLSWELSDLNMMFLRQLTPSAYSSALLEASHVMAAGGPGHGRALGIHLHPWLTGQAFRAAALARALARIRRSPRVWFAPPGDVVDHCRRAG